MSTDTDTDTDTNEPRFMVLLGGAHPEGRMTPELRQKLVARRRELLSSSTLVDRRLDIMEEAYYEHAESVMVECVEFAQIQASLKTGKHITFVRHQNAILNGHFKGEVDPRIDKELREAFMYFLSSTLRKLADQYDPNLSTYIEE